MEGWIQLTSSVYVKPIDWEDIYVIEPTTGMAYRLLKFSVSGDSQMIGTAPTPSACAKLLEDK